MDGPNTGKVLCFLGGSLSPISSLEATLPIAVQDLLFVCVTGIITDGDIRRSIHKKNFLEKTAKEVMTKKPKMISENTLAGSALDIMNKKKITSLIVKGKNNNYGLIHIHSLISFGV